MKNIIDKDRHFICKFESSSIKNYSCPFYLNVGKEVDCWVLVVDEDVYII